MKNYRNIDTNKKVTTEDINKNNVTFTAGDYSYYSKVLKEPFNTVAELKKAEEAYYAKLKAKEDKAAAKRADAQKVEDAFKALNTARKTYKDDLAAITHEYSENLARLKKSFEDAKEGVHAALAAAEADYSKALKAFTEKYPEGFHLTLKDGDFETTIDSRAGSVSKAPSSKSNTYTSFEDIFNMLFGF
jgi:predicted  nucleic acid-binding Zn-ribbon protein